MTAAAERLLGLSQKQVQDAAREIIFGQLRLVIAMMDIEEINTDRDKFLDNIYKNVEVELMTGNNKLLDYKAYRWYFITAEK